MSDNHRVRAIVICHIITEYLIIYDGYMVCNSESDSFTFQMQSRFIYLNIIFIAYPSRRYARCEKQYNDKYYQQNFPIHDLSYIIPQKIGNFQKIAKIYTINRHEKSYCQ